VTKVYLTLKPSEKVVTCCAAQIYSAYIRAGQVEEGSQEKWIERAVREAIEIAQLADASITSDDEMS
jgi:predicted metal-dependent phosphotriesterase family hydrolase